MLQEKLWMYSPLAWVVENRFVNENQEPLNFDTHRFLRPLYNELVSELVVKKSSQIGFSTMELLRAIHFCKFRRMNVIYTLPNRNIGTEFLIPKWNPIAEYNPGIQELLTGTDTPSLKQIGDRYIYFRGTWAETEAISISAQVLIQDEIDRSDQKVLRTYKKRLDAREEKYHHIFSNPSQPEFGVDEAFSKSTKTMWFVTCDNGHTAPILFPESICREREVFQCATCHVELTNRQRQQGQWVDTVESDRKGYWITQLMAPWIPAKKILKDEKEDDPDVFYNYTLGEAYAPTDMLFLRKNFIKNLVPGTEMKGQVFMGIDNGVVKHWVIGTTQGVFEFGKTEDWDEIERIRNTYDAVMVIDALPYRAKPQMLVEKYPGKAWMHYFVQDRKSEGAIRWMKKESVVQVDRTMIIDRFATKLAMSTPEEPFVFHMTQTQMEEYIPHFTVMRRINETNAYGIQKGIWDTPDGKQDHWAFATFMFWVAIDGLNTEGTGLFTMDAPQKEELDPYSYDPSMERIMRSKSNPFR